MLSTATFEPLASLQLQDFQAQHHSRTHISPARQTRLSCPQGIEVTRPCQGQKCKSRSYDFCLYYSIEAASSNVNPCLEVSSTNADQKDCYCPQKTFLCMCSLREVGANQWGNLMARAPLWQRSWTGALLCLFSVPHSGLGCAAWLGAVHCTTSSKWLTNSLKSPAKPAGKQLFILLSCCFLWGQS